MKEVETEVQEPSKWMTSNVEKDDSEACSHIAKACALMAQLSVHETHRASS